MKGILRDYKVVSDVLAKTRPTVVDVGRMSEAYERIVHHKETVISSLLGRVLSRY